MTEQQSWSATRYILINTTTTSIYTMKTTYVSHLLQLLSILLKIACNYKFIIRVEYQRSAKNKRFSETLEFWDCIYLLLEKLYLENALIIRACFESPIISKETRLYNERFPSQWFIVTIHQFQLCKSSLAFVTLTQGTKFPRKSSRFPSDRKVSTIGVAQVRVELRLVHEASRSANIMRTQIPESFIQNGHKIRAVAHSEERRLSQIWRTWIGETVERESAEGWPKNPSTKLVICWGSHEPLSRIQSRLAFLP